MKNIISLIPLFILVMSVSCRKEITQGIGTQVTWFNKSGVRIKYVPFYKGHPVPDYTFEMKNNDSFFLGNHHDMGTGKAPGFFSDYITGMDSFQIIYDNRYYLIHTKNVPDSLLKSYQVNFANERYIGNPENYVWWFDESIRRSFHEYTFIPEDYEYAKEHGIEIE